MALKRPGCYQGCFSESKWGSIMREQQWDLMARVCPSTAAKYADAPNWVRESLNMARKERNREVQSKFRIALRQF